MSEIVKIFYNGQDVFSGIAPTPFASFSEEFTDFGTKWNQVTSLNLNGQLTGNIGLFGYTSLTQASNTLLSRFENNYKTLEIKENNTGIFSGQVAVVNSINIEDSSWQGILPFTIDISIYDSGLFSDFYGIVDPTEDFNFSDQGGDIVSFNHSLSAKGIVTNDKNAIENAKHWVTSRTGDYNKITPILVRQNTGTSYILESSSETIDRFNGSYSWGASYIKSVNNESPENALLNYSINLDSGVGNNFISASIAGTLEKNNTTGILRAEYNNLDLYKLCNQSAKSVFNTDLSSRVLTESVQESLNVNNLSFSAEFNNDFEPNVINDYTVDISQDVLKCITSVSLESNISAKYGDISGRWVQVQDFYENNFSPYALTNTEYLKEVPGGLLNKNPVSESIEFNPFNAQISYSAQFEDRSRSYNQDILSLTSSVSLKPSVVIHSPKTSLFTARQHNVQNLKVSNRSNLSISVTATAKIDKNISLAEAAANNEINKIRSKYIGTKSKQLMEERTISRNNDIKNVSINETWTYEGDIIDNE